MDKSKAYNVLGLMPDATEDQIKNAYRELAKKYSMEQSDFSPLKEENEHKMNELNEAFDALMSHLRTDGVDAGRAVPESGAVGRYPAIRQLINAGRTDEALAELSAVPYGSADAEWNFLMGSALYYKGRLDQAYMYFQEAVRLEPSNREYQAALQNLRGNAEGNMEGNPYTTQDQGAAAMNCACNTCTMMCCMDACCSMCRGI